MKYILAVSAVIFTLGFVTLPVVMSDGLYRWGDDEYHATGMSAVNNPLYMEECGSCHMAYPPGFLPSASWKKLMSQLEDHFDDNAELDLVAQKSIEEFLLANSADRAGYRRSEKFRHSIEMSRAPIRISETPYFRHEHNEIPARFVTGNPRVNSFSHCNACHINAQQGAFNEHDIRIPGYGRWDD